MVFNVRHASPGEDSFLKVPNLRREMAVPGACENTEAEKASLALCEREDSVELIPRHLGKRFMEPADRDMISVFKTLYFLGSTGLLTEWKIWGCTIHPKMVAEQMSPCAPNSLSLM